MRRPTTNRHFWYIPVREVVGGGFATDFQPCALYIDDSGCVRATYTFQFVGAVVCPGEPNGQNWDGRSDRGPSEVGMKAIFIGVLIALLWTSGPAYAKVFEDPDLFTIAKSHQSIAILPCNVTVLDSRSGKNRASPEELKHAAEQYSTTFQNSMYSWFLRMKQKGKLDPKLQDVEDTNALLAQNRIDGVEGLQDHTKEEIAEMLGVDGLFSASITVTTTLGKGGATAMYVLFGVSAKTSEADAFVKLYNGGDGRLIWSFDRTISGSLTRDPDDMVEYLMKRVSKRFPYKRL